MQAYMTQPRKRLLTYLKDHRDETFSAKQISDRLSEISVSAVYRNLSSLEQEGAVRRVNKAGSRENFYQYLAAEECRSHLHLSCKRCGKTFHMDAQETEDLVERIAALDKFAVDRSDTVLYGVCEKCLESGPAAHELPDTK